MLIRVFEYVPEWSIVWSYLPTSARISLLALFLVCIYSMYTAVVILFRLYSLSKGHTVESNNSLPQSLALLNHRSENLRQIIVAMLYLSGFTYFVGISGAFWTPDSKRPVGLMILENMRVFFWFGVVVFFVFLILHSVQWLVSSRIRKAILRSPT
jgi:hypothetical protein